MLNTLIKLTIAASVVTLGSITTQTLEGVSSAAQCVECNQGTCGKKRCGCLGKRKARRAVQPCISCPECNADVCGMEVKKTEVKKTCFKVEQKQVCIPKFRFPWQKCCDIKSKTRTVTVLKKHSYKCPSCEYKWTIQKPEVVPACDGTAIPSNSHEYYESPAYEQRPSPLTTGFHAPVPSMITPTQPTIQSAVPPVAPSKN